MASGNLLLLFIHKKEEEINEYHLTMTKDEKLKREAKESILYTKQMNGLKLVDIFVICHDYAKYCMLPRNEWALWIVPQFKERLKLCWAKNGQILNLSG